MGNSHTHVINHQDDDTDGNDTFVETANQSEESDDEVRRYVPAIDLDEKVLQRLKQRDPTISHLRVDFGCDNDSKYIFNSIDWEEDGYCIADNNHLKKLTISRRRPYVYICQILDWEVSDILPCGMHCNILSQN